MLLADACAPRLAAKFAKERNNIAHEVVKTEKAYAKILSDIVNVFLNPLKESNLIKDGVITEENRRKIFPGALATLAQVHKDFSNALEARTHAWLPSSMMGDLFLNMIPYFKLYPVYVSDFESQMKALKDAKNNERFWEFIKGGFKILKDPSNDLPSLLITPVQRIPRYLMLVKQLLKYTWPAHRDYRNLASAAEQLGKIAEYVDQKAKDAENVQKMHHVQEVLLGKYDTLLDPQRRFVHQGLVYEVKGKEMQLKALFQFSDIVVWAKVKKVEAKEKKGVAHVLRAGGGGAAAKEEIEYHYQSRVPLMGASLLSVDDVSKTIRNCFYLKTNEKTVAEKTFLIATESPEAKKTWMAHLQESIQDVNTKAATLRNQRAMVEEKKATMRNERAAVAPPVAGTVTGPSPRDLGRPANSSVAAATGAAKAPTAAAPAKRSGWLLKRSAKAEVDKTATSDDQTDDTQSAEGDDSESSARPAMALKAKASASGKESASVAPTMGGNRPSKGDRTSNGDLDSSTGKTGLTSALRNGDRSKVGTAAGAVAPALASGSAVSVTANSSKGVVSTAAAAAAVQSTAEQPKKRLGFLGRSKTKEKVYEKRLSAADEGAEMTVNLSPPPSPAPVSAPLVVAERAAMAALPATTSVSRLPVPGPSASKSASTSPRNALARVLEDGAELRRQSRALDLDDLPTFDMAADSSSSRAQLAELKAAFDRLEDQGLTAAGSVTPGRRRSLSAPDCLVRSPESASGPPQYESDDDGNDDKGELSPKSASKRTPRERRNEWRTGSPTGAVASAPLLASPGKTPALPPTAAELQRLKRLKQFKRGSMSGIDLNVGARNLNLKAGLAAPPLNAKLSAATSSSKLGVPAVAADDLMVAVSTPPRPRRNAPKLAAAAPPTTVSPPAGSPYATAPVAADATAQPRQEKTVLRRADSVVLEHSDGDDDDDDDDDDEEEGTPMSRPTKSVAARGRVGGLRAGEAGGSRTLQVAGADDDNVDDDRSASDDVGEEAGVTSGAGAGTADYVAGVSGDTTPSARVPPTSTPIKTAQGDFFMQDTVKETVSYLDEEGRVVDGPVDESQVQVVIHEYVDEQGNPISPPLAEMVKSGGGSGSGSGGASSPLEYASERSFTIAPLPDSALVDDSNSATASPLAAVGPPVSPKVVVAVAAAEPKLKDSGRSVLAKALDAVKGNTDMTASEVDLEVSVEEGDSDDDSDAFVE